MIEFSLPCNIFHNIDTSDCFDHFCILHISSSRPGQILDPSSPRNRRSFRLKWETPWMMTSLRQGRALQLHKSLLPWFPKKQIQYFSKILKSSSISFNLLRFHWMIRWIISSLRIENPRRLRIQARSYVVQRLQWYERLGINLRLCFHYRCHSSNSPRCLGRNLKQEWWQKFFNYSIIFLKMIVQSS